MWVDGGVQEAEGDKLWGWLSKRRQQCDLRTASVWEFFHKSVLSSPCPLSPCQPGYHHLMLGLQPQPPKSYPWFYLPLTKHISLLQPKEPIWKLPSAFSLHVERSLESLPGLVGSELIISQSQSLWFPPCFCTIWPLRALLSFSNRPCLLLSQVHAASFAWNDLSPFEAPLTWL